MTTEQTHGADAPANPRFCVWCAHRKFVGSYSYCMAPQNFTARQSLVTGEMEQVPKAQFCETHRSTSLNDRCGEAGRWFTPREDEVLEAAE